MKRRYPYFAIVIAALFWGSLFITESLYAVNYDLRGQLSGWTVTSREHEDWRNNTGLRYIPQLTLEQALNDEAFVDLEASLNGFAAIDTEDFEGDTDLELYRLILRFATNQTESRLGLQKINFGPAQLLRTLRWFDQLDPRDPQQLTDGVYALRFKYNALNNANFWLWGLYGNDELKGYELLPSVEDVPEFGGRFQYPVLGGELAATFHTREVDASALAISDFTENRIALDGRWEVTIGMWFETMLQQQQTNSLPYEWTTLTTLGVDYTFGIGNGLYVLGEHLITTLSEEAPGWDQDTHASAALLTYPIGLFDTLSAVGYYSWEQNEHSLYVTWKRTYDTWSLNLSVFDYPESDAAAEFRQAPIGGYGGQLIVIFYH